MPEIRLQPEEGLRSHPPAMRDVDGDLASHRLWRTLRPLITAPPQHGGGNWSGAAPGRKDVESKGSGFRSSWKEASGPQTAARRRPLPAIIHQLGAARTISGEGGEALLLPDHGHVVGTVAQCDPGSRKETAWSETHLG